eukprot:2086405-Rhodomonas_salina.1
MRSSRTAAQTHSTIASSRVCYLHSEYFGAPGSIRRDVSTGNMYYCAIGYYWVSALPEATSDTSLRCAVRYDHTGHVRT